MAAYSSLQGAGLMAFAHPPTVVVGTMNMRLMIWPSPDSRNADTYPGYVVLLCALDVAHRYLSERDSITSADQYMELFLSSVRTNTG